MSGVISSTMRVYFFMQRSEFDFVRSSALILSKISKSPFTLLNSFSFSGHIKSHVPTMWPLGISPICPPIATAEVDGRSLAKCDPCGVNLGFGGTKGLDAANAVVDVGALCFSSSSDVNAGDAPMESSALVFGLNGDAFALSAPNAGAAPNGEGDADGAPNALENPGCVDVTEAPKLKPPPPDVCTSCPAGLTKNGDAATPVWGLLPNGESVGALCVFADPNGDAATVPPDPNGLAPVGATVVVPNGVGVAALAAPKGELEPAPKGDADVEPNAPLV
jgi:hypothetical protein